MKASEVFREARSVLFAHGWNQGRALGEDGSACLAFAVIHANHHAGLDYVGYLKPMMREATGSEFPSVWNDALERTFDDVIDALDRAEKIAEQRESDV